MITRKAGAALAAGCAMVVKPAHQTPLTAIAAANLAYQVGIPRDVLPIVPVNEAMTSESGRVCFCLSISHLHFLSHSS